MILGLAPTTNSYNDPPFRRLGFKTSGLSKVFSYFASFLLQIFDRARQSLKDEVSNISCSMRSKKNDAFFEATSRNQHLQQTLELSLVFWRIKPPLVRVFIPKRRTSAILSILRDRYRKPRSSKRARQFSDQNLASKLPYKSDRGG